MGKVLDTMNPEDVRACNAWKPWFLDGTIWQRLRGTYLPALTDFENFRQIWTTIWGFGRRQFVHERFHGCVDGLCNSRGWGACVNTAVLGVVMILLSFGIEFLRSCGPRAWLKISACDAINYESRKCLQNHRAPFFQRFAFSFLGWQFDARSGRRTWFGFQERYCRCTRYWSDDGNRDCRSGRCWSRSCSTSRRFEKVTQNQHRNLFIYWIQQKNHQTYLNYYEQNHYTRFTQFYEFIALILLSMNRLDTYHNNVIIKYELLYTEGNRSCCNFIMHTSIEW